MLKYVGIFWVERLKTENFSTFFVFGLKFVFGFHLHSLLLPSFNFR